MKEQNISDSTVGGKERKECCHSNKIKPRLLPNRKIKAVFTHGSLLVLLWV
jgi:hypothetical protein